MALPPSLAGDGVAQRSAHARQDRRLEQEASDALGLTPQNLLDQVVDDVPVIAGEARDEARDIVPSLHGQARKLDRRDPAFGPRLQGRRVRCGQGEAHDIRKVGGGLAVGELQVGGTDLDEVSANAQARQRQRRIGTRGDHEVDVRRQVIDQELDAAQDLRRSDHVEVVQHQHDVVRDDAELVEQWRHDGLDRGFGSVECPDHLGADPGRNALERRDHVGPEGRGMVVARVEREPRCVQPVVRGRRQPLSQRGGLAEARRSGHEGEPRSWSRACRPRGDRA